MRMMRQSVFVAVLLLTGCFTGIKICPTSVNDPVEETYIHDAKSCLCRDKVAIIDVEGLILNAKTSSFLGGDGDNPVSLFRERLQAAADDKRVKAVVLRINSPGGGVTASGIMYQGLLTVSHGAGQPVGAFIDGCGGDGR